MITLFEYLSQVKKIVYAPVHRVERTVAEELQQRCAPGAAVVRSAKVPATPVTRIAVVSDAKTWKQINPEFAEGRDWAMVRLTDGGAEILSSAPHLLYQIFTFAMEDWKNLPAEDFRSGKVIYPTFRSLRPTYDSFLTMHNRTVENFDREEYICTLARMGCTHAEVNGLAFAVPIEQGPAGENLHRFYTYCPALDQFVSSFLNRGIYDDDYLQANLNYLRTNAELAEKYGLRAGITCFEPRSVPDRLLERYPMLRGARVDHPIRSLHPRYNLSIAHPIVQRHYAELMENLLRAVPQIDYMAVWSNDSGAGFEYTSSLYVGRNGGGYVIREWKGGTEIAEAAANNLIRFHRILRDAGRKVNPKFRTMLRLEAFAVEQQYIWSQLEDGIDVEASSLVSKGWDVNYTHPKYPERRSVAGTALFNAFAPEEKKVIGELRSKGSEADVYFWPSTVWNHEPLLGIPYPHLVFDKLKAMSAQDVSNAAMSGGVTPTSFVPYNINEELLRAFQADNTLSLDAFMKQKADAWIGPNLADDLVKLWNLSDEAYRGFPVPVQIYSGWGVWYRVFTRPIVPNIEKISEEDRRYYEQFMLATTHNRCRVDFRYDVGFELSTPEDAKRCLELINGNVLPVIDKAVSLAASMKKRAVSEKEVKVAEDAYDRFFALKCWYRNQRNVTAWIAGVHGYLETKDAKEKQWCRKVLRDMVLDEIDNTKALLNHWETAKTKWMIVSEVGETTFIYYKNFGEHLKLKLKLMKGRENDTPYVDPDFQWRVPGLELPKK
ncbi:MAG: hypothetical protein ACM3Q4_02220 [Acidobacteriota bacterium]